MSKKDVIQSLLDYKQHLEDELKKTDEALSIMGINTKENSILNELNYQESLEESPTIFIPESYSEHDSWGNKILYILKDINKSALVDDILEKVCELEEVNNMEKNKIHNRITQTASSMFRKGKIDAIKNGRKYRYKIKSPL